MKTACDAVCAKLLTVAVLSGLFQTFLSSGTKCIFCATNFQYHRVSRLILTLFSHSGVRLSG